MNSDDSSMLEPVYHNVNVVTIQNHCFMISFHSTSKFLKHMVYQDKCADASTLR